MIQRTIIDPSQEQLITLEQVKNALGFGSRADKDDEITTILNTAIAQVEEHGDVSLRSYNVQVSYPYADTENALYLHPVSGITSVMSMAGHNINFRISADKRCFFLPKAQPCIAKYTTEQLDKSQAQPYIRAALELSMLLFNGNIDTSEQAQILRKISPL